MDNEFENPKPRKGEPKDKFISRCISQVSDEHPKWSHDKVVAVCHNIWRRRHKNEEMFTDEVQFMFEPVLELESEETEKPVQTGTKNMIAVIGDRFMNGGFLSKEVLEKSYKKWNGTLHDVNHMGTSTGFFLAQSDVFYFVGWHSNVEYNKGTGEVSMQLNIYEKTKFAQDWQAYVDLCQLAGRIPNVSVTYYGKRDWILASTLPKNVPWKAAGYGKDDLVPILNEITPVCVSTVLQGRCNDKDGCGLRNDDEHEDACECNICAGKLENKIEKKKQEIIERIKAKKLALKN